MISDWTEREKKQKKLCQSVGHEDKDEPGWVSLEEFPNSGTGYDDNNVRLHVWQFLHNIMANHDNGLFSGCFVLSYGWATVIDTWQPATKWRVSDPCWQPQS